MDRRCLKRNTTVGSALSCCTWKDTRGEGSKSDSAFWRCTTCQLSCLHQSTKLCNTLRFPAHLRVDNRATVILRIVLPTETTPFLPKRWTARGDRIEDMPWLDYGWNTSLVCIFMLAKTQHCLASKRKRIVGCLHEIFVFVLAQNLSFWINFWSIWLDFWRSALPIWHTFVSPPLPC